MRAWTVCLVEPNRFEAQVSVDLLRMSGFERITVFAKPEDALHHLRLMQSRLVFVTLDCRGFDAINWVKRFRRDRAGASRKSPLFLFTRDMTRAAADHARLAGANAIIGRPTSARALANTIRKALANARPFVDEPNYSGPCRRTSIIATRAPCRRRGAEPSDAEQEVYI